MTLEFGWDINTLMYVFLLILGGFFMAMQLKLMLFPQMKGRIVEFEDFSESSCRECKARNKGKMSFNIKIRTEDGELIDAEMSPCTLCLDKLRIGSKVGITKMGSRTIAQSCINLGSKGNDENDLWIEKDQAGIL